MKEKVKNIDKLKEYWAKYVEIESDFFKKVAELEENMRKELKDEGLEFAYSKLSGLELFFGIGYNRVKNSGKRMIHDSELVAENKYASEDL